jgi:hypothetical protein
LGYLRAVNGVPGLIVRILSVFEHGKRAHHWNQNGRIWRACVALSGCRRRVIRRDGDGLKHNRGINLDRPHVAQKFFRGSPAVRRVVDDRTVRWVGIFTVVGKL